MALGQPTPDAGSLTDRQWLQWIADAGMLIDARMELLAVTTVDEAKRDYVVREAVVAQVRRPDDATQVTVSVDDGQTSKSYRSGTGRVTIRDEWWILLGLTDATGMFAIDMAPSTVGSHLPWCDLMFGGLSCSCGVDIAGYPIFEE